MRPSSSRCRRRRRDGRRARDRRPRSRPDAPTSLTRWPVRSQLRSPRGGVAASGALRRRSTSMTVGFDRADGSVRSQSRIASATPTRMAPPPVIATSRPSGERVRPGHAHDRAAPTRSPRRPAPCASRRPAGESRKSSSSSAAMSACSARCLTRSMPLMVTSLAEADGNRTGWIQATRVHQPPRLVCPGQRFRGGSDGTHRSVRSGCFQGVSAHRLAVCCLRMAAMVRRRRGRGGRPSGVEEARRACRPRTRRYGARRRYGLRRTRPHRCPRRCTRRTRGGRGQAEDMLSFGRERASRAGLDNVEFLAVDAEELRFDEETFDAILSRQGLQFLPDVSGALERFRSSLQREGRLAAAVWGPLDTVQFALPIPVIFEELELLPPPPGRPGAFALADADALERLLFDAGFRNAETGAVTVVYETASPEDFTQWTRDVATSDREPRQGAAARRARAGLAEGHRSMGAARHARRAGRPEPPPPTAATTSASNARRPPTTPTTSSA